MTEVKDQRGAPGRDANRRLSLYRLLDPAVLADPYPLYEKLRRENAVGWDPFLHAWVVTRYDDVVRVLTDSSADRTPSPEQLAAGMQSLGPIAEVMVGQMLFLDAPAHTRVRRLAAKAFTPRRVEVLRLGAPDPCWSGHRYRPGGDAFAGSVRGRAAGSTGAVHVPHRRALQ